MKFSRGDIVVTHLEPFNNAFIFQRDEAFGYVSLVLDVVHLSGEQCRLFVLSKNGLGNVYSTEVVRHI